MANAIATVGHAAPRHVGVLGLEVIRNVARSLAHDFKAALDPKLPETVGPQLFSGHAGGVCLDLVDRLEDIWVRRSDVVGLTITIRRLVSDRWRSGFYILVVRSG
jgi:hypothetical protein